MAVRILTSLVGLPVLIFVVLWGGIWLKIALAMLSLFGLYEIYTALDKKILPIHISGYVFSLGYIFYLDYIVAYQYLYVFFASFLLCTFIIMIALHTRITVYNTIVTFFGFFYVTFLLSHIYLVRIGNHGDIFIWLVLFGAWACDTGAYFVGICFGKHKLIPLLSPKKTVEGALGGIVVAALFGLVYGWGISHWFEINLEEHIIYAFCSLTCGLGAVFAQLGDLTASAIKRFTGIKDFGKIFPGHGGVLDRFDSVLFTAPVVYIMMTVFLMM